MVNENRISKKIILSGRVQGVGFRYFTYEQAVYNNLCGYVKNLPDGQLEILVEGNETAYCNFVHKVMRGPSLAKVLDSKITDNKSSETFNKFEIRY